MPRHGQLVPRPIAACPYCGDHTCYQQCVSANADDRLDPQDMLAEMDRDPEPDDFETYNRNEAMDYLNEGGEN